MADQLEEALSKIRPHVKSALTNQSAPAKILVAVEATLKEQGQAITPTSYFASLLTTLEEAVKREQSSIKLEEGAVVPSTLYLLALVLPHTPAPVIRSNLSSLLAVISPLFSLLATHAPPLRSQLAIFAAILPTLDPSQLTGTLLLRQSFASVLELCVDPRPKVRKKAQEVVLAVLSSPPPPLLSHPYADQAAEYVVGVLSAVAASPGKTERTEVGIWTCSFVKTLSQSWPEQHLVALLQPLLELPSLSSQYLTAQSYGLLSTLLQSPTLTLPASTILDSLLASTPTHQGHAAPWLDALENTMVAYARTDPLSCSAVLDKVWHNTWTWVASDDPACRIGAEKALAAMARYCITDAEIQKAVLEAGTEGVSSKASKKGKGNGATSTVGAIITNLDTSIHSVGFAKSVPSLLAVLTALVSRLRLPVSSTPTRTTAAEVLLVDLVKYVGGLRTARGFEYREQADSVLGMAIAVLGPETFLNILPLNLLPDDDRPKNKANEGRAFLLPLLASHVTNTRLSHFTSHFLPLSEQLFDLKLKADADGKTQESKVWQVLTSQVWACFKGYCDLAVDLREAFTTQFARLLTQLLYTQATLRTSILHGLRALLQTNLTLASSTAPPESLIAGFGMSQVEAQANLEFLKSVANNMVSVLFNVFSSCATEERGLVGEVVKAWLGMLSEQDIRGTFEKVLKMLKDALAGVNPSTAPGAVPVSHTTLDILILLLPFLSPDSRQQLFEAGLGADLMENADAGVQKRDYRILGRLVEQGVHNGRSAVIQFVVKRLGETAESVHQGAQRDRMYLLTVLVPSLPNTQLHFIPSLLPEAVLATKEVSEKARNGAFDLLVVMAKKMSEGGVLKRSLVDGMDSSEGSTSAGDVSATVEEYMTMVAAGLAGSTPHMISATITAISRLLFEFKDVLPATMQTDLLATIIVFLKSANREIVKSAIGFVKLAVITLPVTIVRPQLAELVPALLGWSHDHKNHFKTKVQHIFERMGRRFGWQDVMNNAGSGNEDGVKVLENVKKRKEKAKKQKAKKRDEADDEEDGSDEEAAPKPTTGDAFQDVLYGSDSEAEDDSDNEEQKPKKGGARPVAGRGGAKGKQQNNRSETRIRADNDEPMDLLHGGANATSSNQRKRRQPGQEASKFKTDEASGRMVIDEDDNGQDVSPSIGDELAGAAYKEQMTTVDGFTRGPNGKVKFNKNTKKRRAEEARDEDVEMADGSAPPASSGPESKKKKRQEPVQLGAEFKAKKAGGDVVRRGQQDPYAYLPLSSVGSKKKGGAKFKITGKR